MRNILPNVRVNLAWRELVSPPCQLHTLKNQIPNCTEDKFSNSDFKHAVGHFLIVLKHKNGILHLQIFRKHAKITYLFLWKTVLQPVVLFWKCAFCVGMSVFVLVCVIPPTYSLPRNISTPRVASLQKTQHTAAMEVSKWTGSIITDSTRPIKPRPPTNKLYDHRHIKTQINQLISLQFTSSVVSCTRSCCVSSIWQPMYNKQYLEFIPQYQFQPLAVIAHIMNY